MSRSFWQCPQYFSNVYVSQGCITTPEIRLVLFRQWIQNILGSSNSFWRFCDVGLSLGWFCSFCLMSVWVCVGFVVFACVCIQGCRMNGDIKGEKSARRSRITYRNEENRPFGCKKKKKIDQIYTFCFQLLVIKDTTSALISTIITYSYWIIWFWKSRAGKGQHGSLGSLIYRPGVLPLAQRTFHSVKKSAILFS